jgi:hypothetical protein
MVSFIKKSERNWKNYSIFKLVIMVNNVWNQDYWENFKSIDDIEFDFIFNYKITF